MSARIHIALITLLSACGLSSLAGCGGGQGVSSPKVESANAADQFNPLGDLLSQAQSALTELEDPSPEAEAVTRFVILTAEALPADEASLEALVTSHFKLTTQALLKRRVNRIAVSKLIDRFSVTHLPVQADLPINIEAFQASAQSREIKLSDLRGLTFVSYQGRALRQGLQVSVTCQVSALLTDDPLIRTLARGGVWVASLSTLELLSPQEFSQRCQDPRERWVKPGAELVEGGVRLISRGLNQWGRPELELGPLSRDLAPKRYPLFRKVMEAVRSGSFPESEVEGVKLVDCLRPPHHYDTTCRRLTP